MDLIVVRCHALCELAVKEHDCKFLGVVYRKEFFCDRVKARMGRGLVQWKGVIGHAGHFPDPFIGGSNRCFQVHRLHIDLPGPTHIEIGCHARMGIPGEFKGIHGGVQLVA